MEKKLIKILIALWIFIAVMLTALLIMAIATGKTNSMFGFVRWEGVSMKLQKEENISLDNIDNIMLDFSSTNIEFLTTDKTELRVVQWVGGNLKDDEKFTFSKEGNTLSIKEGSNHVSFYLFNFGSRKIEVYIPTAYKKNLDAKLTSGNINLSSNISLGSIKTTQSSGNLNAGSSITADEASFKTSSGNMKVEELLTKTYQINASSGNVEINSLSGSGQIEVSSGNIKIDYKDIEEYSKVKASSGNLSLSVPKDMSFEFHGKCTSGDISSNLDLNYKNKRGNEAEAKIGDGPYKNISADTNSGNIKISQTQ